MFQLSESELKELLPLLECLGVVYISAAPVTGLRPMMSELHSGLVELTKKLKSIAEEVEGNLDNFMLLMNALTYNTNENDRYKCAFQDLVSASQILETLLESVKSSPIAKIVEFEKPARTTNWAL
jgi:hypothetical protein